MNQFELQLRLFLLLLTVCSVSAFSSGAAIVNGQVLMSRLYCGRQPLHRAPFHLNMTRCGGYCHASLATDDKFRIDLSDNVYWDSVINVTISSLPGSQYRLTGFAVSAVNSEGSVVGFFEEMDNVTVAVCNAGTDVEGTTAFHTHAQHNRTSVTLRWTGPTQNYNDIKFRVWIVHSHDTIFYLESAAVHSQRNGSSAMNLLSMLSKLLGPKAPPGGKALDTFEDSFLLRHNKGYLVDIDDPFKYLRMLPRPEELIPAGSAPGTSQLGSVRSAKPVPASTIALEGKGRPAAKKLLNVSASAGDRISSAGFQGSKTSAGSGSNKTLLVASNGNNTPLGDSNAGNASPTVSDANTSPTSGPNTPSAVSDGSMFARISGNNVAGGSKDDSTPSTLNRSFSNSSADLPLQDDTAHRALFKEADTLVRNLQTVEPIVLQGPSPKTSSPQNPDRSNTFSSSPNSFLRQQSNPAQSSVFDGSTRSSFSRNQPSVQPLFRNQQPGGSPFGRNPQSGIPPFGNQQSGTPFFGNQQTGSSPFGGNQQSGVPLFGNQQSGTPFFGNQQIGSSPFGGNQQSGVPLFGNQQSGTPFFGNQQTGSSPFGGDQQSGLPPFGNQQSNIPPFRNQQPGSSPFGGNRQSGIPSFGNQQSGTPPFQNQQSGVPSFGNQQSGVPSFGNQQPSSFPFGGNQQSRLPFGNPQFFRNFGVASNDLSSSSPARFQPGFSFGAAAGNGSLPTSAIPGVNSQGQNFLFDVSNSIPGGGIHFGNNNANQNGFTPFGSNSFQDGNTPFGFSNPTFDGNIPFGRPNTLENFNRSQFGKANGFTRHPFSNNQFGRSANPIGNSAFPGAFPGPFSSAGGGLNGLQGGSFASASTGLSSRSFLGGSANNLGAVRGPFAAAAFPGSNRVGNSFSPFSTFLNTSPFASFGRRPSFGNTASQRSGNNFNLVSSNSFGGFNSRLGFPGSSSLFLGSGSNFNLMSLMRNPFLGRSSPSSAFSPISPFGRPSFGGGGSSFRPGLRFSTRRGS